MITYCKAFIYCILFILLNQSHPVQAQAVKGQSMRMHTIPLSKKKVSVSDTALKPVIAFVSPVPYETADPETKNAFDWLKSLKDYSSDFVITKDLPRQLKKSTRYSLIWIHRHDTASFSPEETSEKLLKPLRAYVENGGKLLLTLQAIHYLNNLGFESQVLQDSTKICKDNGYGRRLGFHSFRDHPVFNGMNGGAYICRPSVDITTRITGLFGDHVSKTGKVIGVDWDYIFLREDSKLVFEYMPGRGKVLGIGGYMNFTIPNSNTAQLSLFTQNCFNYLLDKFSEKPAYYWDYTSRQVADCQPRPETDQLLRAVAPAVKWDIKSSPIDLSRRFASENYWDVAGERLLTMGTEKGGIEEIWAHPFMALRDYEAGIRFAYKDTIYWLNDERPEIEVNPSFFARQYKFARAYLREVVVNDPTEPNGVIHYEYRGVYPAELIIRFKSNLRWMWPYSDRVTGSICHSWDSDLNAITIQDQSGDLNVIIGGTKNPVTHLSGQFDGLNYIPKDSAFQGIPTDKLQVSGMLSYKFEMNDNLDVVFSASMDGFNKTYSQFNESVHDPEAIYKNALLHSSELLSKNLMISTPDQNFNKGYRWALLASDRFFVHTPGMGKALVAGYSTTRHGWDGEHKVNGRPGYSWYFGRDAEWSAFAMLDYGDFDKVKSQLEFFNKYQDLNGKIFHEASTSGVLHYDAADATPLYIVLAGKYFRHTIDTAFLRKTWPNIKRAINFCYSTDTDQDHLIENTNVGHGWVEGGELYGSHSTIYMAGAWGAALTEAATMARFMKDIESESYTLEAGEQGKIIDQNFWSEANHYFAYGMDKDGSYRREQTILPAVPIYFRMTEKEKAASTLKNIAGNAFTTNWGARILREDSPYFKPTGYHYGSVWPLFTGWASLAEYATGNASQGFSHLMNNLNVYRNWGLGFVEEVLNGSEYQPSGVCAHQCWSETMVLQPAIEGMLGLEVNAQNRKIVLSPQIPPQWDSLKVENIRLADQFVSLDFIRRDGIYEYQFTLDRGQSVSIDFMPSFPAGTRFLNLSLDGKTVPFTTFKSGQAMTLFVSIELRSSSLLRIETESGISVIPAVSDPKPGDRAEGMRILSSNFSGTRYEVEVEGLAGSSGILGIWSNGPGIREAENALFLEQTGKISRFIVDFETSETKYLKKVVAIDIR
jgi:glycogen debranching enzyme